MPVIPMIVQPRALEFDRLGPGREARTVDHDQGAVVVQVQVGRGGRFPRGHPAVWAVRIGEGGVLHAVAGVVEGVRPAPGAVDQLIGQHERTDPELGPQRPDGRQRDHLPHPDFAQGPEVGPVGHPMGREAMIDPMPRQERDLDPGQRPGRDGRARGAERRVDLDIARIVEQ